MITLSEDTTNEARFLTDSEGVTTDTQPPAPRTQVEDPSVERAITRLTLACGDGVLTNSPCATHTECETHGLQPVTARVSLI